MITEAQVDDLRTFNARANSLLSRRILTSGGLSLEFSIKFAQNSPLQFMTREPDEEDLRSFLVDLRPFTMAKERVHLGRTMNLLNNHLTDVALRDAVRLARSDWKKAQRGVIRLTIDGQNYNAERVFDLLINGYWFHDDAAKRDLLEQIGPIGRLLARQQFIALLQDGIQVVAVTRNIVTAALHQSWLR